MYTAWRKNVYIVVRYVESLQEILETLSKFQEKEDRRLGLTKVAKHRMELTTPDVRPINATFSHAVSKACKFEMTKIDNMLHMTVVLPAQPEWASPTVFAPEKDGCLQFCIGYIELSAVTVKEAYPIPQMNEFLDSLGDMGIY